MFHIHVLRVKCESLPQGDLLRTPGDSADIITRSIEDKPDANVGRGSLWHIGNVKRLDEGGVSFAMGRKQAITVQQFDDITHDFIEEEAMRAPFTFGVFDPELQICGVIRKAGVSQNTMEVAGKLAALLNAAPFARQANSKIVVEAIPDPVTFLQAIRSARAVLRFSFTVTRPNPMDVDRLIQGPAKEFTEKADGEKSKVETEGPNLNKILSRKSQMRSPLMERRHRRRSGQKRAVRQSACIWRVIRRPKASTLIRIPQLLLPCFRRLDEPTVEYEAFNNNGEVLALVL